MHIRVAVLALLLFLPLVGAGAVRVNEVAWMGSGASAADEWIELYNAGSEPVSLDGWTFSSLDGSPSVPLSGTISGGAYYLLERTDDESVPNITADLVASFGNGLSNTGETMQLLNAGGTIVDEVVGGENWGNIGGDNATKETAQRTGSGWVTGSPTPRAENVSAPASPPPPPPPQAQTNAENATTSANTGGNTQNLGGAVWTSSSPYPRANITATLPEDTRGYVGATTTFVGLAKGMYDEPLPYATYRWNFGDGMAGEGNPTAHIYQHPGSYLVVMEAIWGEKRATDRLRVEITRTDAVIVSIGTTTDGVIVIHNTSGREMDLSGWSLGEGVVPSYFFPPHSIVLPGETISVPLSVTGIAPKSAVVTLSYTGGAVAHQFSVEKAPAQKTFAAAVLRVPSQESVLGTSTRVSDAEALLQGDTQIARVLFDDGPRKKMLTSGTALSWALLLFALVLVGAFAMVYVRTLRPVREADQYEIIEEIEGEEDAQR